ncbi:MAG TPA: CBS domain-containing protein [Gemmatimonadales bacterium]|nr:CBS domain-containing protein [Gemmatimonadales bacterium]
MKAQEMMTTAPACCTPESTVREAAQLMLEHDCGCIPVVEKGTMRLIGVVTDRDIACRCVAQGKGSEARVREVMTTDPRCCHPEDDVAAVEQIMMQARIRRVPVVDARGDCVGMIAQADVALHDKAAGESEVGRVVERISEPGHHEGGRRR